METKNLPTLKEVYNGDIEKIRKNNDLNILLNAKPKEDWVKDHPFAKVEDEINGVKVQRPVKFITIERVEYLLTAIFGRWRTEIREVKLIANSIQVTVRLYYWNIAYNDWDFQDGVGAVPIQIDSKKGQGAIDFQNMKSNAIQLGAPAAESFAIKDAAHKIGKIFGKELNRRDDIDYQSNLSRKFETKRDIQRKISELLEKKDEQTRDEIFAEMMEAESSGKDDYEFYVNILNKIEK